MNMCIASVIFSILINGSPTGLGELVWLLHSFYFSLISAALRTCISSKGEDSYIG